jgi:hypothetical protein
MRLLKRTYALPPDILQQFEQTVAAGKRSAVIAALLYEWLDKQRQEQLRRDVIEGCREMADVYLEIEQEYHPLEEEVHRGLDAQPQTRRHRARSA